MAKRKFKIARAKTFRWIPLVSKKLPGEVFVNWLWWRSYMYW